MRIRTISVVALIAGTCFVTAWTWPRLCDSLLGTPEEIAATPRSDRRIEQLAIRVSNAITANQQTYDRLLSDTHELRAITPSLRTVIYQPIDDGNTLIIKLTPSARALLALGLYRQWDCLNAHYRLQTIDASSLRGLVLLQFRGTYDMRRLAQLYARLPGIERAERNVHSVIGTRQTFCVTTTGAKWHYVVYENSDRPRLHYFTSVPRDGVIAVDTWEMPQAPGAFETSRPSWVEQYWNTDACA